MPAGCNITQPNFLPAGNPVTGLGGNRNVVFRIPTPIFGAGLIEAIPDSAILANVRIKEPPKRQLGVIGHPNANLGGNVNRSGNDGTITRFGWKAQNKSLLMFAGEAYNVEMGISNEVFPQERDETASCQTGKHARRTTPQHPRSLRPALRNRGTVGRRGVRGLHAHAGAPAAGGADAFDPARQAACSRASAARCAIRRRMTTGRLPPACAVGSASTALVNQQARLYSDLLVHHMGAGLADGITPGRGRARMSSAPRRCGASGSGCSSCTTAAPAI